MTAEGIRRVAVIGGGLGGLSAVRALRMCKFTDVDVCLYEKRCSPHLNVDRGIGIWPDATKCLKEMKVALPEHVEEVAPAHYRSKRGFILSQPSTFNNVRVTTMNERDLVDSFMKTLEEDERVTFYFGEEVKKVHQTSASSVRVYSNWDSMRDFDMVICADGWESHYRLPVDASEHNVRCISGISPVEIDRPFETLGEMNYRMAVVPLKEGCFWFINVPRTAFPDMEEDLESIVSQLEARMHNWHKPIPEVLASTLRHTLLERRTYPTDLEDIESFHNDRVVLIGDAAHRVGINLAQGGSMAIEDGYFFAHCLGNWKELETVHYVYEKGRRARHSHMRQVTKFTNWLATKPLGFMFSRAMWFVPHTINVSIFHRALNYSFGYKPG